MTKDLKNLSDIKHDAQHPVEVQALNKKLREAKAEIKKLMTDYGDLRAYFSTQEEYIRDHIMVPLASDYARKDKASKVESNITAVLHNTDWHMGEVQEADEVEGFSSFSPEQLKSRILYLNNDFMNWIEVHRNGYNIDELVILDTGDNISGDIHEELRVTNAYPAPVQAVECGYLKAAQIAGLAPYFNKVTVEFLVPDNHSRIAKKVQAKQAGLNTHNYVVGNIAKTLVSKHKNVAFNIHISHTISVQVSKRTYLICHGHDVMGWAGFPYYGIERKVSREALVRLHEPDYKRFHKMILGHWHAPLAHPWYWIGGSASGTSAYDHRQGRRAYPSQVAWLVHPKKEEFDRIEFKLRDS